jgi:hypothetical protein
MSERQPLVLDGIRHAPYIEFNGFVLHAVARRFDLLVDTPRVSPVRGPAVPVWMTELSTNELQTGRHPRKVTAFFFCGVR